MKNTNVKPIPEGYHTLTPFLMVKGAARNIEFIKNAFGAKERSIHKAPDGTIMHAELEIGDSVLMMSEATEKYPPMPSSLYLYVEDVDAVYNKAIRAGGISLREPTDEFYGDRSSGVSDPGGNQWWIATHIEEVSPEEMKRREEEFMKRQQTSS